MLGAAPEVQVQHQQLQNAVQASLYKLCLSDSRGLSLQAQMQQHLASFMLCDLRRFAMWDSQATRPYALSAATNWSKAHDLGYITLTPAKKVMVPFALHCL